MSGAFHLEVGSDGIATLTFDLPGSRVNLFNRESLPELSDTVADLATRTEIRCLVLLSGKSQGFIAGADVNQIAAATDPQEVREAIELGQGLFQKWSDLPFPTVAAIEGICVGGGTELALASTFIVASDRADTKIGLPETKLGIIPAWGGCTRLPRRVGLTNSLDIILAGKNVRARKALKIGLADALFPQEAFLPLTREFAERAANGGPETDERADLKTLLLERNPVGRRVVFDQARKQTLEKTGGHYPAPLRALEVIRVGLEDGMPAGFEAEARAGSELATAAVSKNLIHIFHLMEGAKKDEQYPGVGAEIRKAAILGAGVMGGGIAQILADKADLPVRIKDINEESLAGGMEHAAGLFRKQLERRWIRRPEMLTKMNLLRPTLDYGGFGSTDLVVEAIVENLDIKKSVFAELAGVVRDDTVLASNTSSLSIDAIAGDIPAPERVVGMHFFNPVDKMPLVEVVVGQRTGARAVETILTLTRRLGKTPVVVQDGPGFLVNRILGFYLLEALWLLTEGNRIDTIDKAMTDWGMPMGPLALSDDVGLDVGRKVAHILHDAFGDRLPLPEWLDDFDDPERLGRKTGRGYYLYERGKRQGPDPEVYSRLGLDPAGGATDRAAMADRMALAMVNEAALCLEEGIVRNAHDLDLAMIMGTGFPPFRGGLCRWADARGLKSVIGDLERLRESVGPRFTPVEPLRAAEAAGGLYAAYGRQS